jgi:phosphohistidine phosphatase
MRLFLLRHGDAEDRRVGLSDAERRLTPEGIEEMKQVARGMRELDLRPDAILSSPLVRARETAELAAAGLGLETLLRIEPHLASGARFDDFLRAVRGLPADSRVLLVGHEPDLSHVVSTLIGGGRVRMRKAALACVEWSPPQPGTGELRWLLNPEQIAGLR